MNALTPTPRIDVPDPPEGDPSVFTSPYFIPLKLSQTLGPAIDDYLNTNLPIILPPYIQPAADAAVAALALLRAGDTATGPIYTTQLLPTADAEFATKLYVDTEIATVAGLPEAPAGPQIWGRNSTSGWQPVLALVGGTMLGPITLQADAAANLQPVSLQQLNALGTGPFLSLAGGALFGPLILAANAAAALEPVPLQQVNTLLGAYLPLAGGTVTPNGLTVSNLPNNAPGVIITPIGMFDPAPPATPQAWRGNIESYINVGTTGGNFADATTNAIFGNVTVYGAPNNNNWAVTGTATFQGTGGTGHLVALTGYGTRQASAPQPTTTVTATLAAPTNSVQVADVTNFQVPYAMPIVVGATSHYQVAVSGTTGPGTITLADNVSVADGTAGNTVIGNNNPQVWGSNIYSVDLTGLPSRATNASIGLELDIAANDVDDAGAPYYGTASGVRAGLVLVGLQGNSAGAPAEIANGIVITAGASTTYKRCILIGTNTNFSQAAFDTRGAVEMAGAHTIWLGDGHSVAWDTAGLAMTYWDPAVFSGAGGLHMHPNVQIDGNLFTPSSLIVGGAAVLDGAITGTGMVAMFAAPPPIGGTTPAAGAFTTLAASAINLTGNIAIHTPGVGISYNITTGNLIGFDWVPPFLNMYADGAYAQTIASTNWVTGGFLGLGGGTLSGELTINDPSTAAPASLTVEATSSSVGAGIELIGNGATTPKKYLRAINGAFQIMNDGYSSPLLGIADSGAAFFYGDVSMPGGLGVHGSTPIAKPTVTGSRGGNVALASLITELAAYGFVTDGTTA